MIRGACTAQAALSSCWSSSGSSAYCQPCISPVWDTALAASRCRRRQSARALAAAQRGLEWLRARQLLESAGDWRMQPSGARAAAAGRSSVANSYYPDLDDTAVVAWAMHQASDAGTAIATPSTGRWTGWSACRAATAALPPSMSTTRSYYLNEIPFADHGALLDPPTSDVTARVVTALALAGRPQDAAAARARARLPAPRAGGGRLLVRPLGHQLHLRHVVGADRAGAGGSRPRGSGRAARGELARGTAECGRRLGREQRQLRSWPAGARGEHAVPERLGAPRTHGGGPVGIGAVRRGIQYLLRTQQTHGLWSDPHFTAPGFPRVFYLRYHGYCAYFPLWALATYRRRLRLGSQH